MPHLTIKLNHPVDGITDFFKEFVIDKTRTVAPAIVALGPVDLVVKQAISQDARDPDVKNRMLPVDENVDSEKHM